MKKNIVLATPHKRHDSLEATLRDNHGLSVTRIREKKDLTFSRLKEINPDFVFFPHWSWLIPADIHEKFPCIIFHMTDVPFGRGGSPLQNLIVRKIYETKLSAIKCVAQLDAGPVYLKKPLSLHGTAEEIFLRAANLMEDMIATIVFKKPMPVDQVGDVVAFERRKPEDGNIEKLTDLASIHDFIRMLDADGYPSAFLSIGKIRLEFSHSKLSPDDVTAEVKITLQE